MIYRDWCGRCDKPLERLSHGAYRQCCDGMAYWSTAEPLPRDSLIQAPVARGTVTGVRVRYYRRVPTGMQI